MNYLLFSINRSPQRITPPNIKTVTRVSQTIIFLSRRFHPRFLNSAKQLITDFLAIERKPITVE